MSDLERLVEQLAAAYPRIAKAQLPESILTHHKLVRTDPAILIAALVAWWADGCDRPRQFWDRVDAVSERVRGRYQRLKEGIDDADL